MPLSKNIIKHIKSLKEKKNRDEFHSYVAEGDKMVADLLPIMPCRLLIATSDFLSENISSEYNIKEVVEVSKDEISKISFLKNPQQVVGIFEKPKYDLGLLDISDQLIIALDGIQDPGNLGTIIRLADWYGVENIVCSLDTVDVYNPKVVQATMGAFARVKIHYLDLPFWLLNLNKKTSVFGTFLDGENMYESQLAKEAIIVMGNEGRGIRSGTEQFITKKIHIPNYPEGRETSESLNVAIATAIVCSEFRRRLY